MDIRSASIPIAEYPAIRLPWLQIPVLYAPTFSLKPDPPACMNVPVRFANARSSWFHPLSPRDCSSPDADADADADASAGAYSALLDKIRCSALRIPPGPKICGAGLASTSPRCRVTTHVLLLKSSVAPRPSLPLPSGSRRLAAVMEPGVHIPYAELPCANRENMLATNAPSPSSASHLSRPSSFRSCKFSPVSFPSCECPS